MKPGKNQRRRQRQRQEETQALALPKIQHTESSDNPSTNETHHAEHHTQPASNKRNAINLPWGWDMAAAIAAVAAISSAVFSGCQFQLSRNALVTSERAWVTVKGATLEPIPKAGDYAMVAIEYENSGQSPAIDLTGIMNIKIARDMPSTLDTPPEPGSRTVLGRDGTVSAYQRALSQITPDEWTSVLKNEMRIYAVGEATYRDIFGQQRRTKFCLRTRGDGQKINAGMDFCPQGNEIE